MTDTPRTDANYVCLYGDGIGQWVSREFACELERELAETKRLLVEARDDVAELLERMKTEGWHRDDRIEDHVALLSRIDAAIKEQK